MLEETILKLNKLLKNLDYTILNGDIDIDVSDIVYDSRKITEGCVFVCLSGSNVDGHDFAEDAAKKGACAIIAEKELNISSCPVIILENTRKALAFMSAEFFENPSKELITIGLTGTKGKTTTACMIRSVLEKSGKNTGLIGTLGVIIGDKQIKTNNTTPESYEVQKYLREMVNAGCEAVVIEVSSLGLKWHRIDAFIFDYAVFTNFSCDHIGENEHKSMEEYLECKSMLFKKCKIGLINKDDKNYKAVLNGHTCEIKTFGFSKDADFVASNQHLISKPGCLGVSFDIGGELSASIDVPIPGGFSVYNALAAVCVCHSIGIDNKTIFDGINAVSVKGRVEPVDIPGNFTLLIDYAHNAVSMENILNTLREYQPNRLITLFGAGGNRAKSRRYEMGEVSGRLSDLSVVTADNSRFEDVMDIIDDIKIGLSKTNGKYVVIPDRKEAIRYCIENACDGDIIVLAGKGHEDYQEIKGVKYHFDEREVIKDILDDIKGV